MSVKATRRLVLLALAVGAGGIAYAGTGLWESRGTPPGVPPLAPVMILLLAVIAGTTALSLYNRFKAQREHRVDAKPVPPLTAARAVVFAKASAIVGALFVGLYGGYGLYLAGDWDIGARHDQAVRCFFAAGAGLLLVVAALVLEWVCKVPEDPDTPATATR
jgi:formate-dependent nitrite reductase membrane component NrfD